MKVRPSGHNQVVFLGQLSQRRLPFLWAAAMEHFDSIELFFRNQPVKQINTVIFIRMRQNSDPLRLMDQVNHIVYVGIINFDVERAGLSIKKLVEQAAKDMFLNYQGWAVRLAWEERMRRK